MVMCSSILKCIFFADDTNLFHSDSDILKLFSTITCELCKLSDWFKAKKLSWNFKKTKYILFTYIKVNLPELKLEINIDGIVPYCVEHSKFLGVIINIKKVSFSVHINYISLKISRGLCVLVGSDIYYPGCIIDTTLIKPCLSYCCIVWGCAAKNVLNSFFVLQKKARRIITGFSYLSSTGPLFTHLKLLKITDIYQFYFVQ